MDEKNENSGCNDDYSYHTANWITSDCPHIPKVLAGGGISGNNGIPKTSNNLIRGPSTVTRSDTGMVGGSSSLRPHE